MRRIFLAALLGVSAVALLLSNVPFGVYLYQVEKERLLTQLERDAFIFGGRAEEALEANDPSGFETVRQLATTYREAGGARVVIANFEGIAMVTNDADTNKEGDSYASRPEFSEALSGRVATGQRFSQTLGLELVYVAVPVFSGDHIVGVVRLTFDEQAIDDAVNRQLSGLYTVSFLTLLFAIALAIVLSRVLSANIRDLAASAEAISQGHLNTRAKLPRGPKEIRELANSFNFMAERLERVVEEQKAFAADASHQLRTPLTALQLKLDHLRTASRPTPEQDKHFEEIDEELVRTRRLIEGLLALSRASSENVERTEVNLAAVARNRVKEWTDLAEESSVTVSVSIPDQALVLAVPTAVEQVIDNFIDNALSVLGSGGTISVTVAEDGDFWAVAVVDSGPGITAEAAQRAFDRFWRGSSTYGGTGLGLAIVRQLTRASGGDATIGPAENGGTIARATFPKVQLN
jgi:signal transduction histidine kinase